MKAVINRLGKTKIYAVEIEPAIEGIGSIANDSRMNAMIICDRFNSALSQHVQSALSSKIELIEKEFTDEWINDQFMVDDEDSKISARWMRDEIIKRLKSGH